MSKMRNSSPQCPTRDYETLFNARAYISEYYVMDRNAPLDVAGSLASFFNFWFNSFNFNENLLKGGRLLELGTGPNLIPTACASRRFRHIVWSDFSSNHRRLLEDWRRNVISDQAADWLKTFDYLAMKEGIDVDGASVVEERLREAVEEVLPCNVLFDNPLYPAASSQFDCVIVSSILECASQTRDSYKRSVSNVARLLKPGGQLLLHGYLNEHFCRVDREYFESFPVSSGFVREVFSNAGFANLQLSEVQIPLSDRYSIVDGQKCINTDARAMLFLSAIKV